MSEPTRDSSASALPLRWSMVAAALTRPYPVTATMVLFVSLIPVYLFLPALARGPMHAPAMRFDRLIPLQPAWALVYGALYFFLILLPIIVVRDHAHIRRTVLAFLAVWITAYIVFVTYPTEAPRPAEVLGEGFLVWGLRALYDSDPPYNCFPSLHVAHSFVSALSVYRVHRGVGMAAVGCAALVGLSTLYTKQHYIADVVAGAALAFVAYLIFLRSAPAGGTPEIDRRVAPVLTLGTMAMAALGVVGFWIVYRVSGQP